VAEDIGGPGQLWCAMSGGLARWIRRRKSVHVAAGTLPNHPAPDGIPAQDEPRGSECLTRPSEEGEPVGVPSDAAIAELEGGLDVVDDGSASRSELVARLPPRCTGHLVRVVFEELDLQFLGLRGQHPPHVAHLLAGQRAEHRVAKGGIGQVAPRHGFAVAPVEGVVEAFNYMTVLSDRVWHDSMLTALRARRENVRRHCDNSLSELPPLQSQRLSIPFLIRAHARLESFLALFPTFSGLSDSWGSRIIQHQTLSGVVLETTLAIELEDGDTKIGSRTTNTTQARE